MNSRLVSTLSFGQIKNRILFCGLSLLAMASSGFAQWPQSAIDYVDQFNRTYSKHELADYAGTYLRAIVEQLQLMNSQAQHNSFSEPIRILLMGKYFALKDSSSHKSNHDYIDAQVYFHKKPSDLVVILPGIFQAANAELIDLIAHQIMSHGYHV